MVPLSFANIYETTKINDPIRRANMARTQVLISGGRVQSGDSLHIAAPTRHYLDLRPTGV
ncbi:hypothetical protein [Mesorhizobium sp.]|uniref:hypothetical protein n=1 Tax=Mesorhizobium sp. TaxID=1871066 RepID=UPI00257B5717|nr:hypothetical protein [Mesorhizobium sp.]